MISDNTELVLKTIFIERSLWLECFREEVLATSSVAMSKNFTDEYENGGPRIGKHS
jgi:hypothetical protein